MTTPSTLISKCAPLASLTLVIGAWPRGRRTWTVYDRQNGCPATLNGIQQVCLGLNEADGLAAVLNRVEPQRIWSCNADRLNDSDDSPRDRNRLSTWRTPLYPQAITRVTAEARGRATAPQSKEHRARSQIKWHLRPLMSSVQKMFELIDRKFLIANYAFD